MTIDEKIALNEKLEIVADGKTTLANLFLQIIFNDKNGEEMEW